MKLSIYIICNKNKETGRFKSIENQLKKNNK